MTYERKIKEMVDAAEYLSFIAGFASDYRGEQPIYIQHNGIDYIFCTEPFTAKIKICGESLNVSGCMYIPQVFEFERVDSETQRAVKHALFEKLVKKVRKDVIFSY